VRQPNTSPLQAIPHEGHVQLEVRGINLDHLLLLARDERLPSLVGELLPQVQLFYEGGMRRAMPSGSRSAKRRLGYLGQNSL